jgi:ClpP class serine protease
LRLEGAVLPWELEQLRADLFRLIDDDSTDAVVLRINSPGGLAEGCSEAAELLRRVGKKKRTIAICEGYCCSAAYWIASAAREVVATPSTLIGSCGAVAVLIDESAFFAELGVTVHAVASAEAKTTGIPGLPVGEADLARVQRLIDQTATQFLRDVGRSSRMTDQQLLAAFRSADVFLAADAMANGYIDRVELAEDTLAAIDRSSEPSYANLHGSEATAKYRELVETAAKCDWWSADPTHFAKVDKQFPLLAERAKQHEADRLSRQLNRSV